ncbi:MAG: SUF system Fe-S cluster assembly protein [Nitrosomonadales bacterium]|nr:SUF system Fe-S cluster assembly protein [Nitrosomonadales bacterium]
MIDFEKLSRHLQEQPTDRIELEARVIAMLRTIYDPEIPVNIYDLGLIYELAVNDAGEVRVIMTLTAPNCPVAQDFPDIVQNKLWLVDGVSDVTVELVWEPPWGRENMSEAARLQLGML